MQIIHFFRHGQAGSRDDYDRLSSLGREQAGLLGRYLAQQRIAFDACYCGSLSRQRDTALTVLAEIAGAPPPVVDAAWNEFDLDAVFAEVGPQLAAVDEGFRLRYDELVAAVRSGADGIHRTWTEADTAIVRSWIEGRFPVKTESWADFTRRIHHALDALPADHRTIAVFTSATPIGISLARIYGLHPGHVMRLAGAQLNTGITVLHRGGGCDSLVTFNATPHLAEASQRTFR